MSEDGNYYGEDCPVGMVQVAFVGCSPANRVGDYKWKPENHAFVDIYVDGQRFNIQIGNFDSARGNGKRRGLHIIGPIGMGVDQHSLNACDLTLEDDGLGRTLKALPDTSAQLIATLQATVERQAAEIARLRDVFESAAWTIQNQPVAKALCNAVTACALGPSDDDGMLVLYDLIPDEWCVPDRSTVTDDIAENIAFAALDAWLTAARKALEDNNG